MTFEVVKVSAFLPASQPFRLGVVLLDQSRDEAHVRFRDDIDHLADPLDAEVLREIPGHVMNVAHEGGVQAVLQLLEELSNAVRCEERYSIEADNVGDAVQQAYESAVH